MGAQHCADLLGVRRAIASTWQMAPRAVDDAQESPSGR